jgi:hypothetical protein
MAKGNRGTYVVGIRDGSVDIQSLKALVSRIEGVSSVEPNYLTHKLTISYDGENKTLELIKQKFVGLARPTK